MFEKITELKKQREIIIIVVAIILLIVFGIYATRLHLEVSSAAAKATNAAEEKSLHIKKLGAMVQVDVAPLGITFLVPKSLQDLQYVTHTLPKRDNKISIATYFSTASLTKLDAGCSDTVGAIGVLVRVPGTYPTSAKNAVANYGILVKQFDGFYIAGAYSAKGCATNATDGANQVAETDITSFLNAVISSVQQIK